MSDKGYVVCFDNGAFYMGAKIVSRQLRKAKIYHSKKYAEKAGSDAIKYCCTYADEFERFDAKRFDIKEVRIEVIAE